MRLLLIEDNQSLRDSTAQYFREMGYIVETAEEGDVGLWAANEIPCDLILLDLMLPVMDGMEIIRRLRANNTSVHILVISARDGLEDRLEALNAGADDYLVKPFSLAEALARVRALLRRSYVKKNPVMRVGDLEADTTRREIRRSGHVVALTALEYRILEYLFFRRGEVVSRADIWERVFEDGAEGASNTVDVYIGYLRKKLNVGDKKNLIHTRRGHGYILEENAS